MIKGYRKRFVVINMLLIAAVLAAVLIAFGINLTSNHYSELKKTMSQVIQPFGAMPGDFHRQGNGEDAGDNGLPQFSSGENEGEQPMIDPPAEGVNGNGQLPQNGENPPPKPTDDKKGDASQDGRDGPRRDESITTVFYDSEKEEATVLWGEIALDEAEINEAVKEIIAQKSEFGEIKDSGLIYYKEGVGSTYRIALADKAYITSRIVRTVIELVLAFIAAMIIFLPISIWLSKVASKPMEDAIKMEREFVANISHDLKTPITVVLANNSILKDNADSKISEQAQWIDSTDEAAKEMMKLINEMLTLSSLESSARDVCKSPVSLSSVVEKAVLQTESLAYDRGISVEDSIQSEITVMAEPEYVSRICNSLLENAFKYEPDGGSVSVALSTVKKKAVLSVKNRGSVISAEDLPHIFERFYRADKSRASHQGHGLGLPIIKQMAEKIGAEVDVSSSVEKGTEFTVTFDLNE